MFLITICVPDVGIATVWESEKVSPLPALEEVHVRSLNFDSSFFLQHVRLRFMQGSPQIGPVCLFCRKLLI